MKKIGCACYGFRPCGMRQPGQRTLLRFVASGGNANPESERNSLDLRSRVSGSLTVSLLGCLPSLGRDTEKIEEIISAKPDAS
jgi:hypothetical protein